MKSARKFFLLALSVYLFFSFSFAQKQTGNIVGTVKESSGTVLPGVNISISSPSLIQRTLTATTTAGGSYRFINLPPGFYTITAELAGFKKTQIKEIRVFLGETVTLDLVMEQGVIEQAVTVTAPLPAVDVKKSAIAIVLTGEALKGLPLRSNSLGVIELAPGIADRAAHGSGYTSNQYQLDGNNITDQWHGDIYADIPYDLIEESEVITAGGKAEVGEFTGAVVNALTKSGGNRLKGELNLYFFNNKLVNYRKDEISPPATHYDTNLILGGPIVRGRLWFLGSVSYRRDEKKALDIPSPVPDLTTHPSFYGKFNYLVNAKNKGFFSYQYDIKDWKLGEDQFNPRTALGFVKDWEHIVNFQHQILFGSNTYLEAKFNYKYTYEDQGPNSDNANTSMHYDLGLGRQTGGFGVVTSGPTWRARLMLDLSHFKDDWFLGSHDFKFGFVFDRSMGKNVYGYVNHELFYDWYGQPYMVYKEDHAEIVPEGFHEYQAYAQDTWTIKNRLTLDLGLRYSYTSANVLDVKTPEGVQLKGRGKMFAWNNLGPRIGAAYALTRDKKTVLRSSWGRYYDFATWFTFYGFGPYSRTVSLYFVMPDGQEVFIQSWGPEANRNIDPNLKRPYADIFSLGIERELFTNFSLIVNYVHKSFRNQVGEVNTAGQYIETTAVDPQTGKVFTVYNQTNVGHDFFIKTSPEELNYAYNGIDVILDKKFSKGWLMQASLHLQKSKGLGNNDPYGSKQGYGGGVFQDPNNKINAYGPSSYNREYQVKLLLSYYFKPLGINIGTIYSYMQGIRYSRQFRVLLNQGYMNVYAVPRNSLLEKPQHQFDLRVEKVFGIGPGRLGILVDVHNIFNGNIPTSVSDIVDAQTSPYIYSIQSPRYFQLGLRFSF